MERLNRKVEVGERSSLSESWVRHCPKQGGGLGEQQKEEDDDDDDDEHDKHEEEEDGEDEDEDEVEKDLRVPPLAKAPHAELDERVRAVEHAKVRP